MVFLRNRLKYALNAREVTQIVAQRLIKIDGKVRTDTHYPTGFMGQSYSIAHNDIRVLNIFLGNCDIKMLSPLKSLANTSVSSTT